MGKGRELLKAKRKEFRDLGIAKKTLILMFTVSLIPLFCTMVMFYWLSASSMRSQTSELIQANLEQSASNVQNFWQTYEDIIQSIYIDDFYGENLEPINLWDSSNYFEAKSEINKRLENIVYTNDEILGIVVMGSYFDTCFYDSITESSQSSVCFDVDTIRYNEYMQEAMNENRIVSSELRHISNSEYGNRDVLYIACQLRDFEDFEANPMGCVMLCIDEQALEDVYGKSNTDSNITLVTNQYGDILSFPQESLAGVNLIEATSKSEPGQGYLGEGSTEVAVTGTKLEQAAIQYLRDNQYLEGNRLEAVSQEILEGRCYVINVQNSDYAMRNFRYVVEIMLMFGVLAGLLCMILAIGFSEEVDNSVKPILRAMDKANQGDLKTRIKIHGSDEFARISHQFNHMIEQIRLSNEQEKDALVRKKNAEIKSLEAQINPHFLYNTLDAINWVALDQKEYTISRMLTSLATILRYSIHKSNEIVEIKSELEYLRKYVYLQQQRFDYSFLCIIDADESILSYKIHKLLIQPLLENILVHGFPGNSGMDEINIKISSVEDGRMIQIIVEDNGVGME
ncbi:MAG: HAMP domain-containing protein, partial [Clostridia bacterium]|nr:HAMP domain-containing protein [Clostridia bacterium]